MLLTHKKLLCKNEITRSGTSLPASRDFWRKILPTLYSLNRLFFIVRLPIIIEMKSNMCMVIVSFPGWGVMYFETNLSFLISLHDRKSQDKNLIILKTKRAFKMEWKAFFIIFKGLSLKQMKINFFGRWESDFNNKDTKWVFGYQKGPLPNIVWSLRLFARRVEPAIKFWKRQGLDRISIFRKGLLGKRRWRLFQGGVQFLHKK